MFLRSEVIIGTTMQNAASRGLIQSSLQKTYRSCLETFYLQV